MTTSDLASHHLAALRNQAVAVAYRMVGSRTEAEDLAQEAMVRVQAAAARGQLRSPEAFTTTVTTRLAIDHLRSARVRREAYVGPWLPEPVATDAATDPGDAAELADTLSFAFLVMLESLGPVERAAFLLHDVFGYGYEELAETLGKSQAACRQIVARARRRIGDAHRPRRPVDHHEHRRVLERFLRAARLGDVDGLADMLTEDATLVSDGGAATKAARHPIVGRDRVVRFLGAIGPRLLAEADIDIASLNGEPGLVVHHGGRRVLACTIEVAPGSHPVAAVWWVLNPDKLTWTDLH